VSDAPLSEEQIAALLAGNAFDAAATDSAPAAGPAAPASPTVAPAGPAVEEVVFGELHPVDAPLESEADITLLLDVPLTITVELGQATMTIRELLELGQGAIKRLDRKAGQPVDVLVNGHRLARGEVVVLDEDFGIRVTDIVSKAQRVQSMGA